MIIDIHTHIFPERIAARSIAQLEGNANIKAATNGMLDGLRQSTKNAGIDYSVVMPVATKPEQFESINEYAVWVNDNCYKNEGRVISFGGIHPDNDNIKGKIKEIKNMGLKGIKLHPDYQRTMIDDIRYLRIIDAANEQGLSVLIHAGIDIGLPEPVHCPPDRAAKMLTEVKPDKVILAHLGGYGQWDMVEEYLVGRKVYFDTSFLVEHIKEEQFIKIIKNHGAEKILFGSDSPWTGQKESVDFIINLPIDDDCKEQILYKNALKIIDTQH